jgi:hypothetical protein
MIPGSHGGSANPDRNNGDPPQVRRGEEQASQTQKTAGQPEHAKQHANAPSAPRYSESYDAEQHTEPDGKESSQRFFETIEIGEVRHDCSGATDPLSRNSY